MAIAEIDAWLKNGDYFTAVQLYGRYGKDKFLVSLFSKGPSVYNRDRIRRELEKINQSTGLPTFPASYIPEGQYAALPTSIKEVKERKDILFKEARDLHSRLLLMKPAERYKAKYRILDLWDEINDLWKLLDTYSATGKLPDPPDPVPIDPELSPVQLIGRRNNLRSYITKGRMKYKAELAAIERKLSELNG